MSTAKENTTDFPQGSLKETPREREEREWLERKLDDAIASGPAVEKTEADWQALEAGARKTVTPS